MPKFLCCTRSSARRWRHGLFVSEHYFRHFFRSSPITWTGTRTQRGYWQLQHASVTKFRLGRSISQLQFLLQSKYKNSWLAIVHFQQCLRIGPECIVEPPLNATLPTGNTTSIKFTGWNYLHWELLILLLWLLMQRQQLTESSSEETLHATRHSAKKPGSSPTQTHAPGSLHRMHSQNPSKSRDSCEERQDESEKEGFSPFRSPLLRVDIRPIRRYGLCVAPSPNFQPPNSTYTRSR